MNVEYNLLEKILHKFLLSNNSLNKNIFEIQNIIYGSKVQNNDKQSHVFITGMPRSGTTYLLNQIYMTGYYFSLTYRDMPYIFIPGLSKILNFKKKKLQKRYHADQIKFNFDSPEAFDEIFLNIYSNDEINQNYKKFINLHLFHNKKKLYLSKNNNNYKRIETLNKNFPNSKILVTFRDPLQQSYSLLKQHNNFCELQKANSFILEYMNYLHHHEFGLNLKPFFNPVKYDNPNNINYWLEQWKLFYQKILDAFDSYLNTSLIEYEKLQDKNYFKKIFKFIDSKYMKIENFNLFEREISINCDKKLKIECENISLELKKKIIF